MGQDQVIYSNWANKYVAELSCYVLLAVSILILSLCMFSQYSSEHLLKGTQRR